ncbi:neurogenic locus notch homolog protein 2 [Patella vulgata]|uniref:neurogenic locus notch homolog protein 2 n=1 Tax=Patella vulgata TaxID=6465 RepID=UPI00217F8E97|nr:neurogenic locus notch homolog protein 2 [Patella vulgata]
MRGLLVAVFAASFLVAVCTGHLHQRSYWRRGPPFNLESISCDKIKRTDLCYCCKDPCDDVECLNNGVCVNGICNCPCGFSGADCGVDLCAAEPCQNNGTCVPEVGAVSCQCADGFTGDNCEEDLCAAEPCQNNGTCVPEAGGVSCTCVDGFIGDNCEEDLCATEPCLNNGTCVPEAGGVSCMCLDGFRGDNCNETCFPAQTELLTRNGGVKYIEDIEIGDEVQVINPDGSVGYSEVWCHSHYDLHSTNRYLEITTQTHVLPISHWHYLPVASNSTYIYKMAQDVQVGDFLLTVDGDRQLLEMVQHVKLIERTGAFSPMTKSGHIVVNGIQASCYSAIYPTTAHVGLTPFRVAYDVTPRAIMDLILAPNSNGVPYVFDTILKTMYCTWVSRNQGYQLSSRSIPPLCTPRFINADLKIN